MGRMMRMLMGRRRLEERAVPEDITEHVGGIPWPDDAKIQMEFGRPNPGAFARFTGGPDPLSAQRQRELAVEAAQRWLDLIGGRPTGEELIQFAEGYRPPVRMPVREAIQEEVRAAKDSERIAGQLVVFEEAITLEDDIGGEWGARVPALPGCVAVGDSREQVRADIETAIRMHLQGLLDLAGGPLLGDARPSLAESTTWENVVGLIVLGMRHVVNERNADEPDEDSFVFNVLAADREARRIVEGYLREREAGDLREGYEALPHYWRKYVPTGPGDEQPRSGYEDVRGRLREAMSGAGVDPDGLFSDMIDTMAGQLAALREAFGAAEVEEDPDVVQLVAGVVGTANACAAHGEVPNSEEVALDILKRLRTHDLLRTEAERRAVREGVSLYEPHVQCQDCGRRYTFRGQAPHVPCGGCGGSRLVVIVPVKPEEGRQHGGVEFALHELREVALFRGVTVPDGLLAAWRGTLDEMANGWNPPRSVPVYGHADADTVAAVAMELWDSSYSRPVAGSDRDRFQLAEELVQLVRRHEANRAGAVELHGRRGDPERDPVAAQAEALAEYEARGWIVFALPKDIAGPLVGVVATQEAAVQLAAQIAHERDTARLAAEDLSRRMADAERRPVAGGASRVRVREALTEADGIVQQAMRVPQLEPASALARVRELLAEVGRAVGVLPLAPVGPDLPLAAGGPDLVSRMIDARDLLRPVLGGIVPSGGDGARAIAAALRWLDEGIGEGMVQRELYAGLRALVGGEPHVCTCGDSQHEPGTGCSSGFEDRCRFEAALRSLLGVEAGS